SLRLAACPAVRPSDRPTNSTPPTIWACCSTTSSCRGSSRIPRRSSTRGRSRRRRTSSPATTRRAGRRGSISSASCNGTSSCRSQPPFFAAMVGLYAQATDTSHALAYLGALEAEHAFWMDGAERLAPGEAYRRVVRLRDGSVLNRYWDDRADPRPESYRPDYE